LLKKTFKKMIIFLLKIFYLYNLELRSKIWVGYFYMRRNFNIQRNHIANNIFNEQVLPVYRLHYNNNRDHIQNNLQILEPNQEYDEGWVNDHIIPINIPYKNRFCHMIRRLNYQRRQIPLPAIREHGGILWQINNRYDQNNNVIERRHIPMLAPINEIERDNNIPPPPGNPALADAIIHEDNHGVRRIVHANNPNHEIRMPAFNEQRRREQLRQLNRQRLQDEDDELEQWSPHTEGPSDSEPEHYNERVNRELQQYQEHQRLILEDAQRWDYEQQIPHYFEGEYDEYIPPDNNQFGIPADYIDT
jgi:hypothetical protein